MSSERPVPITELMGTYLDLPSTRERYFDLALLATELHLNQSEGSFTTEVEGISVVPVNVQREGALVWDALKSRIGSLGSEYSPRTQTILSLYSPPGAITPQAIKAEDAIRTFMKKNEDFPLSFYKTTYPPGTPMATIRGDLTDSGLLWLSLLGEKRLKAANEKDFCIISNTIDETSRTPGYEDKILQALARPWTAAVRGVVEYEPTGFPNIDKAMSWLGLPVRAGIEVNDGNLAVSLRKVYVPAEGYGQDAVFHEGEALLRRAHRYKHHNSTQEPIKIAKNAAVVSSGQLLVNAALNGIAPWEAMPGVNFPRKYAPTRQDISDDTYKKWVHQYRLNLQYYGGQEVLKLRGRKSLDRFMDLVEEARLELGGDSSSKFGLEEALQMARAERKSSKIWPRALHFLL